MYNISTRMAVQCKIILRYLETNKIIGEEKAINAKSLCNILITEYPNYFSKSFSERGLRTRIMFLKRGEIPNTDMVRIIGSNKNGYFLAKRGDKSLEYQKRLAVSYLETAIKSGIPKEYFYRVLNELNNKDIADNQVCLPVTENTHKVAHIYSDDLLEET